MPRAFAWISQKEFSLGKMKNTLPLAEDRVIDQKYRLLGGNLSTVKSGNISVEISMDKAMWLTANIVYERR